MKSPFPGMDPYLESDLWSEVHHELISKIRKLILPLLGPKYVARIERYVVKDTKPQEDIGIMYPDVEIFKDKKAEPAVAYGKAKTPSPPTIIIPRVNIENIPTKKASPKVSQKTNSQTSHFINYYKTK